MLQITPGATVIVGVDTHKDQHVAVALDHLGRRLSTQVVPATRAGYQHLAAWAQALGPVAAFGIEGTGSYGSGVARHLAACGHHVVEVNRPDRALRHRQGKDDPLDAEMAARAVLAGTATGVPKARTGHAEILRMLKCTKDTAVVARTQALNQLHALIVTAPPELRESLAGLSPAALVQRSRASDRAR